VEDGDEMELQELVLEIITTVLEIITTSCE